MPHCIVEHSADIDGETLVSLVHRGALESNLFDSEGSDIKVRAAPYSDYQTGSVNIDFVHVTLRILSGRNLDQKSNLSQLVLNKLEGLLTNGCSISVEVVDIDRDSYAKVIV